MFIARPDQEDVRRAEARMKNKDGENYIGGKYRRRRNTFLRIQHMDRVLHHYTRRCQICHQWNDQRRDDDVPHSQRKCVHCNKTGGL